MPAIGALKTAAIPAAAPQPNNKMRSLYPHCNAAAILLPIAEPVTTIGPSKPAEPPKPTVKALVITCE